MHQGSTVRLIVCKLTKIGDSHTIERYERLTDGNHCRFCSVSKVAGNTLRQRAKDSWILAYCAVVEYHDGSPIPVSIIRHTADNYTLKVEGKACQVQEETLTLFFGQLISKNSRMIQLKYHFCPAN